MKTPFGAVVALDPSQAVMGALPRTPERVIDRHSPETPVTQRQLRRLDTQARRGELRAEELISKYKKATEKLVAKVEFLEADIERRDAAEALNKAARGGGKRELDDVSALEPVFPSPSLLPAPPRVFLDDRYQTAELVAKVEFLEADIERRDAAEALNKAARGGGKRTRYPQGQLFDTDHRERHVEEY
jgi:cell division protein FtsB